MARIILLLALLGVPSGCSVAGVPNPFDRASGEAARIRLDVLNLNFNDATLHVVTGGSRQRLGVVTGKGDGSFTLDWPVPRDVWVEIDLVGDGAFRTNSLDARPGQTLQLLIESDRRRTRLIHGSR